MTRKHESLLGNAEANLPTFVAEADSNQSPKVFSSECFVQPRARAVARGARGGRWGRRRHSNLIHSKINHGLCLALL